jgi:hypothetical protein
MTPREMQIAQWMDDLTKANLMMHKVLEQEQRLRDEGVVLDPAAEDRTAGEKREILRTVDVLCRWIKDGKQ